MSSGAAAADRRWTAGAGRDAAEPRCVQKPDPDAALVREMACGSTTALRRLYAARGRDLLAFLVVKLGDRALAEEVLQDVMLGAWRGARAFRFESSVRTWLLTIAHNKAANVVRGQRARPTVLDAAELEQASTDADEAGRTDNATDLGSALDRLSRDHRDVLLLVFFHGLTIAETADVLGIPQGTVKSRMHRAEAAVRRDLCIEDAADA